MTQDHPLKTQPMDKKKLTQLILILAAALVVVFLPYPLKKPTTSSVSTSVENTVQLQKDLTQRRLELEIKQQEILQEQETIQKLLQVLEERREDE